MKLILGLLGEHKRHYARARGLRELSSNRHYARNRGLRELSSNRHYARKCVLYVLSSRHVTTTLIKLQRYNYSRRLVTRESDHWEYPEGNVQEMGTKPYHPRCRLRGQCAQMKVAVAIQRLLTACIVTTGPR